MSHFSALVITKGNPHADGQKELLDATMPFHEFECTGFDNGAIRDVDITESTREGYERGTKTMLVGPAGEHRDPYADEHYREPTEEELKERHTPNSKLSWGHGKDTRDKVRFVPDGYKEEELPYPEVMTFAEYCEYDGIHVVIYGEKLDMNDRHKYAYALLDDKGNVTKVISRTNVGKWKFVAANGRCVGTSEHESLPDNVVKKTIEHPDGNLVTYHLNNVDGDELKRVRVGGSRWDWWTIGGRYSGKFVDHDGNKGDVICISALDREAMLARNRAEMGETWDGAEEEYNKHPSQIDGKVATFSEHQAYLKKVLEVARPQAKEQGRILREVYLEHIGENEISEYPFELIYGISSDYTSRDQWIDSTRWLTTFAYIKDGEWHEKGDMGWWGHITDKKDNDAWSSQVEAMLASLEPTDWVTCIDCHI